MIANRLASSIFVIALLTSGAIRSLTVAANAAGEPVKQTGGECTDERPLVSGQAPTQAKQPRCSASPAIFGPEVQQIHPTRPRLVIA
jgi:hypothetical protein